MVAGSKYSIENKSDEETSAEDISTLVHENEATSVEEQRLVDDDVFEVQQPARPIYKSIPLKAGVAAVFAIFLLIPIISVFSGNLLPGGSKTAEVADTEAIESEEETARRLAEAENAELKRRLALQNQSFTAEEMEADAASNQQAKAQGTQAKSQASQRRQTISSTPTRTATAVSQPPTPVKTSTPVRTTTQPSMVSRPVVQRPPTLTDRPAVSAQPRPQRAVVSEAPEERLDMSVVAAAGSYGELPSASIAQLSSVNSVGFADERSSIFQSAGTIPISSRTSALSTAKTTYEGAASTDSERVRRPMPNVMQDTGFTTELALQTKEYEVDPQPVADEERRVSTLPQKEDTKLEATVSALAEKELAEYEENVDEKNVATLAEKETGYEEDINAILSAPVFDTSTAQPEAALPNLLLPGSAARVSVLNALTWASDLPRALGSVVLSEALSSDGFEVLPAGTEMIVQIDALSESGAVAMDVVAIVLPGSTDAIQLSIPEGAISILDTDGGYPVARAEDSSDAQMRRIDRQQAMLGALSGVGSYLNRPARETSIFSVNGSSFSREFGNGSMVGSILSGAANEMLRSRSSRLESEADEIMERPTIWSIEKGRALQIFVTQEVTL